jgi:hypothetical protein
MLGLEGQVLPGHSRWDLGAGAWSTRLSDQAELAADLLTKDLTANFQTKQLA